ncbi:aldo/keto reductase [Microbacterium sp.]|uniref:aldo/keto reductase n=1 Tax=Microbacterium sp. TaxID=51671 RepID=UPI00333E757B
MEFRQLGRSGIEVPVLSLGSWNTYSRLTYEAGVDLVRTAVDAGISFFDVAYYRDKPHTEVLWSRLIRGAGLKRDDYLLSEKLWYFDYPNEPLAVQMDAMLRRVDEEYVDVIILEHPREGMDVAAIVQAAGDLVAAGKTRTWGMLNWRPEDIAAAVALAADLGVAAPSLAQLKYSLVRRNVIEDAYAPILREAGISLHASDTMEGGILAGRLNPERNIGIDVGNIRDQIRARVPQIVEASGSLGLTPAQFSLAFCLANDVTASVLFGATRPGTIEENVVAVAAASERREEILAAAVGLGVDDHGIDIPYAHVERLLGDFVA